MTRTETIAVKRQPWMKFYPTDWQADGELGACSLTARGLWIELIALMHRSEKYGFLLISGRLPTARALSLLTRCDLKTFNSAVKELEVNCVFSRDENGVIYSRRMVADFKKACQDQENGKSGGSPKLVKSRSEGVNPPVNAPVKGEDKAQKPEARSQISESEKKESPLTPPLNLEPPGAEKSGRRGMSDEGEFKIFYKAYPRKKNPGAARRAFAAARKKASLATLIQGLKNFDWPTDPNYCPYPASWLNGERWLDQPATSLLSESDRRVAELLEMKRRKNNPPDDDSGPMIDGDFENV